MSKKIIIILGVILILVAIGIWVYLLIFGTSSTTDVFTDLDTTEIPRPLPTPPPGPNDPRQVDVRNGLQQLTTRAVAGSIIYSRRGSEIVRYVEQGTAHVYEINLSTNTETRISNTTIPRVHTAVFAPDGQRVALQSMSDGTTATYLATINSTDTSLDGFDLPLNLTDPFFTDHNTFLYTLSDVDITVGYEYNLDSEETTALFTIPLSDIRMLWAESESDNHFVVTKSDSRVRSYAYEIINNQLRPTTIEGLGLLVERSNDDFLISRYEDGELVGYSYNTDTNISDRLSIAPIPEKCAIGAATYCAGDLSINYRDRAYALPEAWYKGTVILSDNLWEIGDAINPVTFETISGAQLLVNLNEASGQRIDATDVSGTEDRVIFRNRIDNTLWTYGK